MTGAGIFVAGSNGQVALSLKEKAAAKGLDLSTHGRPDFDLSDTAKMRAALMAYQPSAIINAAAYTAVDAAEDDEATATKINADGAGALAAIAADLDVPFLHISTDYVFAGDKDGAYFEDDPVGPTGAYGRSKLAGERAVMAANSNAMIFRTAWVYSPYGKNFCKTMLALAKTRDSLGVVGDQWGNPTYAPDIAEALLSVIAKITDSGWKKDYAGIYHLTGTGDINWHGFATEIFKASEAFGCTVPTVNAITTAEFPTPAKRPTNSRLNCDKVADKFGVRLEKWQISTDACVKRLLEDGALG